MSVTDRPEGKVALFAGEGVLPVELARRLSDSGAPPLVITQRDDPEIFSGISEGVTRLKFPRLGGLVRAMRRDGATRLIMAGLIPKKTIYFLPALFDSLNLKALARGARDDHSLLGAVVSVLEEEGISVLPYWQMLPEFLALEGRMTSRAPTEAEMRDVTCGAEVLRVLLPCSFGQALVVADGAVVAVEAMEGTDAMIERAGTLVKRGVVVKMMRSDQDPRYDIPTIGPRTIERMIRAGLTCLAVEACRTLIMEPQKTLASADERGIAVWGLGGEPLSCQSS